MTESQLTLFVEDSPVSHSQSQVSKEVRMMIDTYGQKCSGLSKKSTLDGLLVKMLADSSVWHSKMCHLTWNVKAMKSGRLLFQLVPKTRTTDEIESGLLPTPTTQESSHPDAELTETGRRLSKCGTTSHSLNLQDTVVIFPTPSATDGSRGAHVSEINWKNGRCYRESLTTGTKFGATLSAAVNSLLPTPSANEDAAGTPNGNMQRMLGNCKEVMGETEDDFKKGALNPDWVEPLMGYPVGWTDLQKDNVTHEITDFVGNPDDSGEPRVTNRSDGRSQRLKQLGNSIVPQVAREIFRAIKHEEPLSKNESG